MAQLNVNPADLLRTAQRYTDLAARTGQLSPQATAEVQRVAATHGPMGYPTAVGIAAALSHTEPPLTAKTVDFQSYSQRFTEHAATYTTEDHDAARRYRGPGPDIFEATHANSIHLAPAGYIIWCTPDTNLGFGFQCEHLYGNGLYKTYWSQWDKTGGW
ncbi:type VII secretion target [Mycobacterium sp.]|uniref:type VII secretion target n=1 Tax=Mycobacterium sp. TaxID=1785 RepID=UPI0025CF34F9|nr:type VII secretion target [Mycobacterium sp.]